MQNFRNVIVIGASAGGIRAVSQALSGIDKDVDAAVLVVMHLSDKSNIENIARTLQKNTKLRCNIATDRGSLERGNVYVAIPNHHLMVVHDEIRVTPGAYENKYRPSIDVLFRSAAVHYGHRAIGVILTGMLEDGTSGMSAIKKCGGLCIVQDPDEAEFSDMPLSVINKIQVDYIEPLKNIGHCIDSIATAPLPRIQPVPEELRIEASLSEKMASDVESLSLIANQSNFSCPDCGGRLWAVKNDILHRHRCYTGHVYTERLLQDLQDSHIDNSVWVSIRMLEEKSNLMLLMGNRAADGQDPSLEQRYQMRARDIDDHIARLKKLLQLLSEDKLKF